MELHKIINSVIILIFVVFCALFIFKSCSQKKEKQKTEIKTEIKKKNMEIKEIKHESKILKGFTKKLEEQRNEFSDSVKKEIERRKKTELKPKLSKLENLQIKEIKIMDTILNKKDSIISLKQKHITKVESVNKLKTELVAKSNQRKIKRFFIAVGIGLLVGVIIGLIIN